ncbi:MAG: hypothetical protein QXK57_06080 [Conexivisphaerales archaeon]
MSSGPILIGVIKKYLVPVLVLNISYVLTALISFKLLSLSGLSSKITVNYLAISSSISILIFYVFAMIGGALLLYLLMLKKAIKLLKYYIFVTFITIITLLTLLELPLMLPLEATPSGAISELLLYLPALIVIIVMVYALSMHFFRKNRPYYFAIPSVYLCIMLASALILFPDALTLILILIAISAYDIFAVFVGPLKQVTSQFNREKNDDPFNYLLIDFGYAGLGLGDVLFYNVFIAVVIRLLQNIFLLVPITFLNLGFMITIYLLKYRRPLPALPIPLTLGLISLLILIR